MNIKSYLGKYIQTNKDFLSLRLTPEEASTLLKFEKELFFPWYFSNRDEIFGRLGKEEICFRDVYELYDKLLEDDPILVQ